MPTYEYQCTVCGHQFEKFQSMTEAPLKKCPECGKKVQRLFGTGAGIMFKGSGFYQTDYKRTSQPPSNGAPKNHPPKNDPPKSEPKPSSGKKD